MRWVLVTMLLLATVGCVERTIKITSEPAGALVYLNDEEVGRTPVAVPFTFYGTYDVRLEAEGYQPLWTSQEAKGPWWEAPGPDLFAEAVPHHKVELDWHFVMKPKPAVSGDTTDRLIDHAKQFRAMLRQESPDTQPAK